MNWPRSAAVVCFAVLLGGVAAAQGPGFSASAAQLYQRGVQLVGEGKASEAVKYLSQASNLDADNVKVHNMLGVALTSAGHLDEAEAAYDRALTVQPDFLPARKNRAVTYFEQRRRHLARREFEELARLLPDDFVPPLFLGLLALDESDLETAAAHLSEARARAPHNPRVLLELGKTEAHRGRNGAALELLRQALAGPDLTANERLEAGFLLARLGANREAADSFRPLWSENPTDYNLGFNLSLMEFRAGDFEAALQTIDQMKARDLQSGELMNLRGWVQAKLYRFYEARESFEAAIALDPGNADHYLDLSTVLNNEGHREEALEVLSQNLERSFEKGRLVVQVGLLHRSWGKRDEAEIWCRRALQVDPGHVPAYLALAVLLSESQRVDEAFRVLDQGLESHPRAALLYYAYGALLLEKVEDGTQTEPEVLQKAEKLLRRAAELEPSGAETHYLLGKISARRGDPASARALWKKAVTLDPGLVKAYYQLGRLARRRGDKEEAAKFAVRVRRLRSEAAERERDLFTRMMEQDLGR